MLKQGLNLLGVLACWVTLSGCPVSDDYFLTPDIGGGPSQTAGTAGTNSMGAAGAAGELASGGGGFAAQGGRAGWSSAGAIGQACVPAREACNGRDDDCDSQIDQATCPAGCSAMILLDAHGYMFCSTTARRTTWQNAKVACAAQGLELVSIQSAAENDALSSWLESFGFDNAAFIGATDFAREQAWRWDGGALFWEGDGGGDPVAGAFQSWLSGAPDNANDSEDCGVLDLKERGWGDRSCTDPLAYICEEP